MAKKLRFLFTLLFVMAATLSWGEKYKLTISPLDFKTSSYNDNNTVKTTQAVSTVNASKTLDVSWASYQVYQNSGAMQWQKNVGYIYNKTNLGTIKSVNIEISTNGGTFTTYYGTSEKPSSSTEVGGGFFKTNVGSSTGKTTKMEIIFEIEDEPSVSAPTFAPAAGTYSEAQNVSIACDTESANIYYTLDGSEPTDASTVFTSAIPITETTTVKAIAYKDGKSSDVAEATYTIIPAGAEYVTLWSEDFSSYSQGDVPNGGIYSYNCTNGGGTTRVYDEALADGSKPELLVAKNNGSFTAVVPLKNVVGDLTLTYKTNANSLNVYTTTEGIEGSITSTTARTHSVTFKGITANTTSITIVFKATTGSNVRLDDIVLTGLQLPSAVKTPVISLASGTYFGTQSVRITCETADAKIYYTLDGTDPTSASTLYESAIPISETTTLKAIAIKDNESSNVATAEYTIAPTYENNNAANVAATSTDSPVRLTLTEALVVYKNGNNTYLKDASGGMLIYGENNLNVGDKVTGHVDGDLTLYSGLPEIKKPVFNVETVSQDNEVTATVVDAADLKANPMKYVNQYVKVSPAKFAEDFTGSTSNATNANFTVGETELILRNSFKLGVEVSKDKDYAISGMATIFIKDGETNVQLYPTNTDSDIEELHFVAQIGDVKYETLQAAFAAAADGATITLLANCFGNGIVVAEGKYTNGLTVDFGGYTFTVDGATVGSTGTETQAFQLLRNNNITFKNGTITSEKAKILVQNYSNLTLEKMTLTLANEGYAYGYTLSNNNGKIKIDNSTIKANTGGGFAFDVCRYSSYPSVEVTVTGESVINGNVEVFASDNDAKDGFKLMLESGKINGDIVIDASASAAMSATPDKAIIMENDSFGQAAPEGYKWESNGDGTSTLKKVTAPAVVVSAPVVFHDSGEYEAGLSVPMYAQAGAKIYYTTDGSEPTTASTEYTGALTIKNATTLKAIAVLDGVASAVVTREYTIKAAADEIVAIDGYYSIKNNGNGKFVNVAGRKTVTFTDAIDDKAGTVIKVKANKNGQVEVLRSQGVDLPGYAKKAMNYVPEIVELVVNKLHAAESGEILGEHGLDAIMKKFNDSFDYHLYVEKVDAGYRIYGKTPSMKPVVDFYAENKANVDIKLPKLEAFINSAIQKVLQKTGGRGASILTDFSLHEIWEKMGGTLTEPTDETSTAKFYEEVLSSEANVWNFAYQTAMKYWEPLIKHEKVQQNLDKLGDYAKYLEKVENIQPDFKYYIVGKENGVDFISDGNIDIQNNAARTIWTLEPRADFKVTFDPENVKNGGTEYYATLYTDFGYELAEGMKAYKVTEVDSKDYAKLEEIGTQIPAQTPVLLMTTDLSKTTLTVKDGGDAVTGNLLVGPDYLINEYQIKTAQVEGLFNLAKDNMGEEFYNNYVKEYEHLMLRNAGTVNNKYFFGLEDDDMNLCTYKNESDEEDCVVRNLGNGEKRLGFYSNWKVEANKAFLVNEKFKPVKLTKIPDVNRDGMISVDDVTAMIDIIMEKDKTVPYKYDHDAALITNDNIIDINDVNYLIDIILEVKEIEE